MKYILVVTRDRKTSKRGEYILREEDYTLAFEQFLTANGKEILSAEFIPGVRYG